MSKKKIVFVINSLSQGGAERVLSILIDHFSDTFDITLVLLEDEITYPLPKGLDIVILSKFNNSDSGLKKTLFIPIFAWRLRRVVKTKQPDLLLSFLFRADFVNMLASMLHKKPALISARVNTSSTYADDTIQSRINKFLVRILYPKAKKIISVSEGTKVDLIENFNIPEDRHEVIYNPYDIEKIRKLSQEPVDLRLRREKTIVVLSRFRPIKNIGMIIQAFAGMKEEANLLIVGEGQEAPKLHNLAEELGVADNVHFVGAKENPYPYLALSDIYVSASRSEGFPNAMVEAMICGCAIVSTDCPSGPREILAPESDLRNRLKKGREYAEYGVLVALDDVDAMREVLINLLESEALCNSYSKKALQRAADFRIEYVCRRYEEVMCDAIAEGVV
jgi:N-acetylgalactosamine-N,N'-diacetylbacillosaminyl-diphospho-undecaprenol 4-alpha-N-acetylgalactosaminyltransferase